MPDENKRDESQPEEKLYSQEYVHKLREEDKKWRLMARDLEEENEKLRNQTKEQERKKLEEQAKFKELYESTLAENTRLNRFYESYESQVKSEWESIKTNADEKLLKVFDEGDDFEIIEKNVGLFKKMQSSGLLAQPAVVNVDSKKPVGIKPGKPAQYRDIIAEKFKT